MSHDLALPLILTFSVGSLFVAGCLAGGSSSGTPGPPPMQEISNAIKEGAEAFLRRQNRTIGLLAVLLGGRDLRPLRLRPRATTTSTRCRRRSNLAFWTTLSFVLGAACSVIAGYVGMWISIRTNIRTASAARTSLNDALRMALRGGAVSGLFVVAMSLLGVGGLYWLVSQLTAGPARRRSRCSSSATASARRSWRSSPSSAAASTPRRPTSAPTSSARSRPASPRTTRAIRPSSRTSWATTSATAPAAAPTSSNPRPPRTSAP